MKRVSAVFVAFLLIVSGRDTKGQDNDEVKRLKDRIEFLELKLKLAEKENLELKEKLDQATGKAKETVSLKVLRRSNFRGSDVKVDVYVNDTYVGSVDDGATAHFKISAQQSYSVYVQSAASKKKSDAKTCKAKAGDVIEVDCGFVGAASLTLNLENLNVVTPKQ